MRFAALFTVGCLGTEYMVDPGPVEVGDVEVIADRDTGPCVVEVANGLMFCALAIPSEEAELACQVLDAELAPAPESMEEQTLMAYGALLHFGDVSSWWISSDEYDEAFGCTLQTRYGSWAPGNCTDLKPFVCAY